MQYRQCTKCLMDTTDRDIKFDDNGVCNYCLDFEAKKPKFTFTDKEEQKNLEKLAAQIKKDKKGKYDCIIGLSGGVDSSYVCYLAWKLGLSPLCVHFDNGWNSEVAVNNIKKILNRTGFDYETHVINWPEFKDLQRSF